MAPQQPGDPNMELARQFAEALGPALALPASLQATARRAELVHAIDGSLVTGGDIYQLGTQIATQLRRIAEGSGNFMQDVPDALVRINVVLRLWSGCISAAKTIAHETRSGPNTPAMRRQIMEYIESIAAQDPVYAAGVEAAPAFKRLRNQTFSLDGVPENSLVRREA